MNKYVCYREAQIERVKDELNRRLPESDNSIEITMKSGKKFLVGKQAEDYLWII